MHELAWMSGRMNQMARIGIHHAPQHYTALQRVYISCLHKIGQHAHSQPAQVFLDCQAVTRLMWWASPGPQEHNGVALRPPPIDIDNNGTYVGLGSSL